MASTTFALRDRCLNQISELCRQPSSPTELLRAVLGPLRMAVPFDAGYLSGTDPATTLFSSAIVLDGLDEAMCAPSLDNEFMTDDFNKFVDLHRTSTGPTTLRRATFDRMERSPRHEINARFGFEHELRASFGIGEACWGVVNLLRVIGCEDFSDAELEFVDDISLPLAEGLRSALTGAPPLDQDPHILPGVILMDPTGVVTSMTDRAVELVGELGHVAVATEFGVQLPGEAYVVGARARARAAGFPGPDPIARVRAKSGGWLTVRAECTRDAEGGVSSTAVVIEPSRTSEVLPLFVAAHGLSDREKEVLAELVDGRSTTQIADVLFISAHTVRDHVKSILDKVGVSSRGQLISELYRLHYEPGCDVLHIPRGG